MTLPKTLTDFAVPRQITIGRSYDTAGRHVTYWHVDRATGWRAHFSTVSGMLGFLRRTYL